MEGDIFERGDVSKFNPAMHKMNRIHLLCQTINDSKLNLEAWNMEWNDFNFNVYFKSLVILYQEVFSKFNETEREDCEKLRKPIEHFMNKYPIKEKLNNGKYTPIDKERLRIFKKYIEDYEEKVKDYQDLHGLDTPNMEDDEGL